MGSLWNFNAIDGNSDEITSIEKLIANKVEKLSCCYDFFILL